MRLNLDFETRSEIDLLSRGAYVYAKHPSTVILCAAYSVREDAEEFDPNKVRTWRPWEDEPMPRDLRMALVTSTTLIEAWNAQFERLIILEYFKRELAAADTRAEKNRSEINLTAVSTIERYRCTAARARACALPGKLELAARFLHTPIQKNMAGNRLMKKWCAPLPTGGYADDPGEYDRLVAYCVDDVNSEGYIGSVIRDLTPVEWTDYAVNERLNDRGIPVDVELAKAAQHYAEAEASVIRKELSKITCGEVQTPKQYQKLKDWVIPRVNEYVRQLMTVEDDKTGEKRLSLDKHVRTSILDDPDVSLAVSDEVLTVLELVDDAGRSSTAKFKAIENRADEDGRLRGCYILNGAGQTGRKSAHGFQPHNLVVRERISNVEDVVDLIMAKAPVEQITLKSGKNILATLACLMRGTIIAEPKKILVWRDYSAVEARALPWLSNDPSAQDLLDRFARGDDVYLYTAADIYSGNVGELRTAYKNGDKDADRKRQVGKVACIAEGQPVLTPRGLVPIEQIAKSDYTWDGFHWTPHDGVVYKGYRDVWEYDGLIATEDHIVFTEAGHAIPFGLCTREQIPLAKTGFGRQEIRMGGDYIAAGPLDRRLGQAQSQAARSIHADAMSELPGDKMDCREQPASGAFERLFEVFQPSANTAMAGSSAKCGEGSLHESRRETVCELRRPRDTVQVQERAGSRLVDSDQHWPAEEQTIGSRKQRRPLRTGKSAVGGALTTDTKSTTNENTRAADMDQPVFYLHHIPYVASWSDARRDHSGSGVGGCRETQKLARYRGKVKVFDIVNAGPNHRFTVSGVLVHNCLSLGFMGGKGALKKMARAYGITLDDETAEYIKVAFRRANPWVERFGRKLHNAACLAVLSPGVPYEAGRATYLMNGTDLWCLLPCGRIICYPEARVTTMETRWGPERTLTAAKGSWRPAEGQKNWPRHTVWLGLLLENLDQGFCASLLRGALRLLDEAGWPAVMDTHDEIMLEVYEDEADEADKALSAAMLAGDYPGLPLATEASRAFVYGKQ